MKQLVLALSIAATMMACSQNKEEKTTETKAVEAVKVDSASTVAADSTHATAHAEYACPMKCEKEKTYSEAGKCPVCKMDLAQK